LAAVLAACGNDESAAPGGGGVAPDVTPLPDAEVNDVVYLRTLTSLQMSIVMVYASLSEQDGLADDVADVLSRFIDDNVAAAAALGELTAEAGGEPYECENAWLMNRSFQPIVDHVVGVPGGDNGTTAVPPTDDPDRDTIATANALETIAAATAQQFVEHITDPALRAEVTRVGTAASRRAAVSALRSNPPPAGYVSPMLTTGEPPVADEEGFTPVYAIYARYGQLTAVPLTVGDVNEEGLRFTTNIETPAENAFIYEGMSCPG
jgi:hypothetical protein